ncbi:MAG: HAD-IA family hydrolase [candidate division WOR-3 bacterium]
MPLKLIIFDLDGTLVDSRLDIMHAVNYAISPYGVEPVTPHETTELTGEGATRLMEKLLEKRRASLNVATLLERFESYYSTHPFDHTVPYPSVPETLRVLQAYPKAIISNKFRAISLKVLEGLKLSQYFEEVAGVDTFPERKPSPVPILRMVARFGVRPEEAVVVGDSINDIDAGRAAGTKTVAVTYGYGSPGFSANADFVITEFRQLIEVIDQLNAGP